MNLMERLKHLLITFLLQGLFKDLNNAFLSKYEDFLVYSSATACMYKDEHVRILLSYDEAHSTITLTYTYEYKPKIGEGI